MRGRVWGLVAWSALLVLAAIVGASSRQHAAADTLQAPAAAVPSSSDTTDLGLVASPPDRAPLGSWIAIPIRVSAPGAASTALRIDTSPGLEADTEIVDMVGGSGTIEVRARPNTAGESTLTVEAEAIVDGRVRRATAEVSTLTSGETVYLGTAGSMPLRLAELEDRRAAMDPGEFVDAREAILDGERIGSVAATSTAGRSAGVTVRVHVTWEDADNSSGGTTGPDWHGVPRLLVQVRDAEAGMPDKTVLQGVTDVNGRVELHVDNDDGWLQGGRDIYVRALTDARGAGDGWYRVAEPSGLTWSVRSRETYDDVADGVVLDFELPIQHGSEAWGGFSVHAALYEAAAYTADRLGSPLPSLEAHYPSDGCDGVSCYRGPTCDRYVPIVGWRFFCHDSSLELTADTSARWDTVHHEYGHYVQYRVMIGDNFPGGSHGFADNLSDTLWDPDGDGPGGLEVRGKDLGTRLAWSEAWATYFAVALQLDRNLAAAGIPGVGDTKKDTTDLEVQQPSTLPSRGEDNELALIRILLDLHDPVNEAVYLDGTYADPAAGRGDSIALGADWMWRQIEQSKPQTLSAAAGALLTGRSAKTVASAGCVFAEHDVGPEPTSPADGAPATTSPPMFTWDGGNTFGSHPNDAFRVQFWTEDWSRLIGLGTPSPESATTFTPDQADWDAILRRSGGRFHWIVYARQTDEPVTGWYPGCYRTMEVARPANDGFAAATPVATFPFIDTLTATLATVEWGEATVEDCGGTLVPVDNSVWYRVTSGQRSDVTVHTRGSDYDTFIRVYTGTTLQTLGRMWCNDNHWHDSAFRLESQVTFRAEAGQTFYVQVAGARGSAGELDVSIDASAVFDPGDLFDQPHEIHRLTYTTEQSTAAMTTEPDEPLTLPCEGGDVTVGKTVWFRYTVAGDQDVEVTASTDGSEFDTVLAVYRYTTLGSLRFGECDDDGGPGSTSELTFTARGGNTYYIQVGGYGGASGPLDFTLWDSSPTTPYVTLFPPDPIDEGQMYGGFEGLVPPEDCPISNCGFWEPEGDFLDDDSYWWTVYADFGDGTTDGVQPADYDLTVDNIGAHQFEIGHVYADDGTFPIEVCVAYLSGEVGCASESIVVNNVAPLVFLWGDQSLQTGEAFTRLGTFTDRGDDTWTATVDYGEGDGPESLLLQGKQFSLHHVYSTPGVFWVTVTVTDDDGGAGFDVLRVTVTGPECDGWAATIIGTDGDDYLIGTAGDDVIWAGDGNDTVLGHAGDDVVCGGPGDDTLDGGPGDDTLLGGEGADILLGGGGVDTAAGDGGDDACWWTESSACEAVGPTEADLSLDVWADDPQPSFHGVVRLGLEVTNDGPLEATGIEITNPIPTGLEPIAAEPEGVANPWGDSIWHVGDLAAGESASLTIWVVVETADPVTVAAEITAAGEPDPDSTPGNWAQGEDDHAAVTIDGSVPTCGGLPATIVGYEIDDTLFGTDGPDVIAGLGGDDTIYALEGDDVVCGGDGDDRIEGGGGEDVLWGEDGRDVVFGGGGDDVLNGGADDDRLYGDEDWDLLRGNAGADLLSGGDGTDRILAWPGNDTVVGGPGSDVLDFRAAPGPVEVDLSTGYASVTSLGTVAAVQGISKVEGSRYGDTIVGDAKRNYLKGKQGDDVINGLLEDDTIIGGTGADTLYGDHGDDLLKGGAHDDVLFGWYGDDRLLGGRGDDEHYGEEGEDFLNGFTGNDLLDGGLHWDTCLRGPAYVSCEVTL